MGNGSWFDAFRNTDDSEELPSRIEVDDIVEEIESTIENSESISMTELADDGLYLMGSLSRGELTEAVKEAIEEQTDVVEVESKKMLRKAVEKQYDYLDPDEDYLDDIDLLIGDYEDYTSLDNDSE